MPAEVTDSLLHASSLASGLINPQQMDFCWRIARHRQTQQGISTEAAIPDRMLADILVEQGMVTAYQADQLLSGRTKFSLGSYVITDWIGQGGMGQVFKAVHHVMGRICAVKVLPLNRATLEARKNFIQEIRMQAALDCPYLVRAYDAGQDGNVHYLVTEFVPGMDLRKLVKSHGPLPVAQAAKIVMQAALGLEYAHGKGMVHRDVKPGNILVSPGGEAKVSDVGLAGFAKDLINDPRAGKIIGTTDYLSPEQIRTPLEIEPVADIYSLGCTLYYAICGKVPFPGGDTKSKLRRHLEESPVHPRRFAADVPEDFVDIIADMMEKDSKKRIASAAQVAARLEPWASDESPVSPVSLIRSPWLAPPPPSDEESLNSRVSELNDPARSNPASQQPREATTVPTLSPSDVPIDSQQTAASQGRVPFDDRNSSEVVAWRGVLEEDIATTTDSGTVDATRGDSYSGSNFVDQGLSASMLPTPPNYQSNFPSNFVSPSLIPPPRADQAAGDRSRTSVGMAVALTVAIILPPTLLLGAILGFILASK